MNAEAERDTHQLPSLAIQEGPLVDEVVTTLSMTASSSQPATQGNGTDREQASGSRHKTRCRERSRAADDEDQR